MNIMIIHAHTANRGDEAAIRAMIDELTKYYEDVRFVIAINGKTKYPNLPKNVEIINRFPDVRDFRSLIEFLFLTIFGLNIVKTKSNNIYLKNVYDSDIIIHAPGGPSIGDIYIKKELLYLLNLNYLRKIKKKYMFYAPSMGPFHNKLHNTLRKKVLRGAESILVRDPISFNYVKDFLPDIKVVQSMDSALQNEIEFENYKLKLREDSELFNYIGKYDKCIGITITDLKWHPEYSKTDICENIEKTFKTFIQKRSDEGYGIIFIPQLYGTGNDTKIMDKYMINNRTYMLGNDEFYDSYFQQFLISQLYAVIGMRYHSNIFSAKMGIPFISISYEQKMKGFMEYLGLNEYCIDIKELSYYELNMKFNFLFSRYNEYRSSLNALREKMKRESYKSTEDVINILNRKLDKK